MKTYLLDTFQYNHQTNLQLLSKMQALPDPEESVRLFSHLINSQYKWMARLKQDPAVREMSWWDPVYPISDLAKEWQKSLTLWTDYLATQTEESLSTEVSFVGFDGTTWAATPADIALQLNYHSIHHRAQIQTILRQQGIEPDFVDYIGTRYRKIG
ncbi:MAG: DinB family protein [Bacteroidota bacterium]|nr:DinB family protein [Bacteroidota bacterium]